jgi:hypothetical protein
MGLNDGAPKATSIPAITWAAAKPMMSEQNANGAADRAPVLRARESTDASLAQRVPSGLKQPSTQKSWVRRSLGCKQRFRWPSEASKVATSP